MLMFNMFGCAQDKNTEMNIGELKTAMKENPDLIILDVRTEPELTGYLGHLEGIVHIPVQELGQRVNELNKYKDKDIAVICRTGNRSDAATKFLRQQGFDAKNVLGGMVEYRDKE
jgi:rhodanese-related sulfurtransferase